MKPLIFGAACAGFFFSGLVLGIATHKIPSEPTEAVCTLGQHDSVLTCNLSPLIRQERP